MRPEQKKTWLRIVIFMALATIPGIVMVLAINAHLGGPMYSTPELAAHPLTHLSGLGMFLPMLAHVLTRWITKQGFRGMLLDLSFRRGKWKYYLLAVLLPVVCLNIGQFISLLPIVKMDTLFSTEHVKDYVPMGLMLVSGCVTTIVMYFGEEFGWRAYLTPELEKVMSTPWAIVVSGILWGLWHAPLTVSGHNFGMDYPGFPYVGILLMCISCVGNSAILTFLTKRTNSVWPAALAHAFINNGAFVLYLFLSENAVLTGEYENPLTSMLLAEIPMMIAGVACFLLICDESKKRG